MIIRKGETYNQHAYFLCKKDAQNVRRLIDSDKYPYNKKYKIAMQRLLTEEEFKKLRKSLCITMETKELNIKNNRALIVRNRDLIVRFFIIFDSLDVKEVWNIRSYGL